jgi:hypothetical protein
MGMQTSRPEHQALKKKKKRERDQRGAISSFVRTLSSYRMMDQVNILDMLIENMVMMMKRQSNNG